MSSTTTSAPTRSLTLLGFFAITASMVMAVYEYPTFATSGFSLIFFLLVGGIFWFIPVGLCAAEMATVEGWQEGGLYAWVSNTLGERWGFAAISFSYLQIAIGFIPMLYFVLGALSYILSWPELNTDPVVRTVASVAILWGLALTQFKGTRYTAVIAKFGFFFGILFPAIVLVALAVAWLYHGQPLAIEMSAETFFPDFSQIGTLVVLVAFVLSYMGVEASATHVNEMTNPARDYPLAMFLLVIAAIVLSSIGGLSVATVIPHDEINLSAGVMQAFSTLINYYGPEYEWAVRAIAVLLMLGVLAEIASWIVGPSRGMLVTAQDGLLPSRFAKVNKNGVPVALVISQLTITTIALIVLTNTGGGSNMSFLIALSLTVVIYLCSYLMLFLGYIQLVRHQHGRTRAFQIPGGKYVKLVIACSGLLISVLAFVVSFIPPSSLPDTHARDIYAGLLVICFGMVFILPFIVYMFRDASRIKHAPHIAPVTVDNAPTGHFVVHPKARPSHYPKP